MAAGLADATETSAESHFGRDPVMTGRLLKLANVAMRYFSPQVRGLENLPENGPVLLVGNHSGLFYIPDFWITMDAVVRRRGLDAPVHALTFDVLMMAPGIKTVLTKLGSIPASPANAARALRNGALLLVYPGGDWEACRPWWERDRIDFHGRKGFVRLALRSGVPVVPVVARGSQHSVLVLARGAGVANFLRLPHSPVRTNVFPFTLGPPFGIDFVPGFYPPPLPAAVTVRFLPRLDWTRLGPESAENPSVVDACYSEMTGLMQAALDELRKEQPHPVLAGSLQLARSAEHGLVSPVSRLIGRECRRRPEPEGRE